MSKSTVTFLERVDSTSTWIQSQLEAGVKAPFAVVAEMQTAGRGRRGRQWSSPAGNIYMSLAIPAAWFPDKDAVRLAPLWAAVLVAKSVKTKIRLGLTVKWPNDLLFGGCKVGGILCEGSVQGDQFGDVIVGVGINVMSVPELQDRTDGIATERAHVVPACLHDLCGWTGDVRSLACDLANEIFSQWRSFTPENLKADWDAIGLPSQTPWVSSEGTWYSMQPFDESANLRLRLMGDVNGAVLEVDSVHHQFTLGYQHFDTPKAKEMPVLVADVGNSRVKLAFWRTHFPDPDPVMSLSLPLQTLDDGTASSDLTEFMAQFKSALLHAGLPVEGWPVFAVSVNGTALKKLTRVMAAFGYPVSPLARRCLRLVTDYDPAALGADRLAALESWLGFSREPAIIVSCGTAITVDVLAENGQHRGGFIGPGIGMSLRALHEHTALLPVVTPLNPGEGMELGFDTRSAMTGGSGQMAAGLVLRARALARAKGIEIRNVVLTGGESPILAALLKAAIVGEDVRVTLAPDLILEGVRVLALGGTNFAPS